jgi:hypothetical protein
VAAIAGDANTNNMGNMGTLRPMWAPPGAQPDRLRPP